MTMKPMNAAEKIREAMGCFNILLHKEPPVPKPKKISYGDMLKADFDRRRHQARQALAKKRAALSQLALDA